MGTKDIASVDFESSQVSVTGTEAQFPAPTSIVPARIHVQALNGNTGNIWIGKTGVAADGSAGGFELVPGAYFRCPISDRTKLYHIGPGTSEKIQINYLPEGD